MTFALTYFLFPCERFLTPRNTAVFIWAERDTLVCFVEFMVKVAVIVLIVLDTDNKIHLI